MAKRKTKKIERKKLLTLSDLYNFYASKSENLTFSSEETGYKLAVQVPAQFEINKEQNDDSLLFCLVKLMHSGENRNHSSVTDEALIKASKTLAYKPILANFVEYEDPETKETLVDFTSHDMEISGDTIIYYEHQIGCFTADEPYFEVEEDTGHNFLYGYCAIPRSYTDACSVIERKNGTKISVELEINEMQYSATNKVLELTDVTITGATCLGKDAITLNNVEEGMKNARLDIVDFSVENNSIVNYSKTDNEKLIEMLEQLNAKIDNLSNFTIQANAEKTDGKEEQFVESNKEFEEVVEEVTETTDEVVAEVTEDVVEETIEETTEESTEEVVAEETSEETTVESTEVTPDVVVTESVEEIVTEETVENNEVETPEATETFVEDGTDDDDEEDDEDDKENFTKTFELSHNDVKCGLYNLLAPYEQANNDYYWIIEVYDNYFVYQGCNGNFFGQKYTKENDNVAFDGEPYALYSEFLTESERATLTEMRSNYASLVQFKADAEYAELHAQKEAILYDSKYSVLVEKDENGKYKNEAFAKLVSEMDNYSLTDLEKELKSVFADHITNGGQFAYVGETEVKPTVAKKLFANSETRKTSRYGNLFK